MRNHDFRGGKSIRIGNRIAGFWPENIDPKKPGFKEIFDLIDVDWVTSAPNILRDLNDKVTAIRADVKLSELGKREAILQAGRTALNRLKTKTTKVDRLQEDLVEGMQSAIKTPTPSMNDTMIDLAMAAYLREQVTTWKNGEFAGPTAIADRLQDMSERARLAVIRVPAELSGIDAHIQDVVRSTFVDPAIAKHLEDTSYAISVARDVVQATLKEMVSLADIPAGEVRETIGTGWDSSGVQPGRKPADLNLMPPRKADAAAMAAQRAEEDVAAWATDEQAAGRQVTDGQRQAKYEQLSAQYAAEVPQLRTFSGRESLNEGRTTEERQAIIAARLKAEEKSEA